MRKFFLSMALLMSIGSVCYGATNITIFYSNSCKHCHNLQSFIKIHHLNSNIAINQYEVVNDKKNHELMLRTLEKCKLEKRTVVELPILVHDNNCFFGEKAGKKLLSEYIGK